MSEHEHLGLDALADVLAGELPPPGCETCTAMLADLEQASAAVTAQLAAVPPPVLPADVTARIDAALLAAVLDPVDAVPAGAAVTTLPTRPVEAPRRRWLPAAAAAVVLAGGVGLGAMLVSDGLGGGGDAQTALSAGGREATDLGGLVRNDSGNNYSEGSLAEAVPGILAGRVVPLGGRVIVPGMAGPLDTKDSGGAASGGTGGSTGAPGGIAPPRPSSSVVADVEAAGAGLDRLRTTEGLAACLAALLPPDDEQVRPLALDYARFDGQPALLVVLPVPRRADKVDVFVVGAGCAQADEQLLFFARVDRPA